MEIGKILQMPQQASSSCKPIPLLKSTALYKGLNTILQGCESCINMKAAEVVYHNGSFAKPAMFCECTNTIR